MVAKGFQLIALVMAGLFIAGCSTLPADTTTTETESPSAVTSRPMEQADPGYEPDKPEQAMPKESSQSHSSKSAKNRVVEQLQREALQSQAEGNWAESELKLERALRILGDDPDLYRQLATVRMGQQRFGESEQIALKGLTYANDHPAVKAELWQIIAQSRSAAGNIAGAREARQEAEKWKAVANGVE